ncbi:unnamed protein product [Symbiodinium pilosum]|uniref:Sfi1 spindle body domain-containing protein n=1 Tax=Symbiodinium pilosum TaxID=2952 RepID=A0A812QAR0_SYMPI|nr:unnamed protein product [Symbiodinium pilosum]
MPGFAEGSPGSKPARMGRMGEANLQHLLGLDDISSHARRRASMLEAAKAHEEMPAPGRRARCRTQTRIVQKGRIQPEVKQLYCREKVREVSSRLTDLVICCLGWQMLQSSFHSWRDQARVRERRQLQEAGSACQQAVSRARAAMLESTILQAWRYLASRTHTAWRLQVVARNWEHHIDKKAFVLVVQSWFNLAKMEANRRAAQAKRSSFHSLRRVILLLWASCAARSLSLEKVTRIVHSIHQTYLMMHVLRLWSCKSPAEDTRSNMLPQGQGMPSANMQVLLRRVWHRWFAAVLVKVPSRPKAAVALAWSREDMCIQRAALTAWRATVMALEYTRDLRLLQSRLSSAINHAGHLAQSRQDIRGVVVLLHVFLTWRVVTLQAWQERLQRTDVDSCWPADSAQTARRKADFQHQVILAWREMIQVPVVSSRWGANSFEE